MKEKQELTSFNVDVQVPAEFLNKYCTCYLKQCLSGVGVIRGMLTGFRNVKGQDTIYLQADDEHDFFIPLTNVAYYELISLEALQKSQEQSKAKVEEVQHREEENIRGEIEVQMKKVEEQFQNANKSENSGDSSAKAEGDSEFVFKL